jgi:hypothetical protein
MAKIVFQSHGDPLDYSSGLHVLTFAEEGFAPLDIHGRKLGISRDTLSAFSDGVNQADDVGSLYPQAAISAVPRSCIRDTTDPARLLGHLRAFIQANASRMEATRLLLDFSTPQLQPHVQEAISKAFNQENTSLIVEVIVIKN